MPKIINWDAIKQAYAQGGKTHEELAREFGCCVQSLRNKAATDGWKEAREEFRANVAAATARRQAEDAANIADLNIKTIRKLRQAHADLVTAAAALAADADQFRRHIVNQYERAEEVVFDKRDARALKDVVGALDTLMDMQERLYGGGDGAGGGVILLPERDREGDEA